MTAKSLRHRFQSAVPDESDTSLVRPSNWNDEHNLWMGFREVAVAVDTIGPADHLSLLSYNTPTGVAVTLPAALGAQIGWKCKLLNVGAGDVTLTPEFATINGSAVALRLAQGSAVELFATGSTDFRAIRVSTDDGEY